MPYIAPWKCRRKSAASACSACATIVRERNIYRWAGSLIGGLCAIRTTQGAGRPPLVHTGAGYP